MVRVMVIGRLAIVILVDGRIGGRGLPYGLNLHLAHAQVCPGVMCSAVGTQHFSSTPAPATGRYSSAHPMDAQVPALEKVGGAPCTY